MSKSQLIIKSLLSKIISVFILIFVSPLMLLVSILIKMTSKGPVLFNQERVGYKNTNFKMYKFRTMIKNAEELRNELEHVNEADGPVFKIKDDPRITKFGKFLRKSGLDELPQIFNVLLGDMDLVGPRPALESEVIKYEDWQRNRLNVKPGITCIWQISPDRHSIPFDEWVKMDLHYINNWSIKMELSLIFKTFITIVRGDGH